MPIVSVAQQKWAYANQGKNTSEGAAARDFIATTPKAAYKDLPAKVEDGKPVKRRKFGQVGSGAK